MQAGDKSGGHREDPKSPAIAPLLQSEFFFAPKWPPISHVAVGENLPSFDLAISQGPMELSPPGTPHGLAELMPLGGGPQGSLQISGETGSTRRYRTSN